MMEMKKPMVFKRIQMNVQYGLESLSALGVRPLALLPVLIGAVAFLVLHANSLPVQLPSLVFQTDPGSALGILGLLVSLPLLAAAAADLRAQRDCQKHMRSDRLEHDAERRRFIHRLDHELKNPLTGLRAALANLAGTDDANERAQIRADAQRQAERLSRLVADLRKLADLEERPLETGPVDLGEVLEETIQAVCGIPAYSRRAVRLLVSQVPWPLPRITGDRDLLGLAFYNLIENSLKYSGPGDAVEVRASEDGHWIRVEVADTGPGISAEDLPRLFEELYRGSNARGVEGSGLGLALVRRVIDRHGGQIAIRSRQNGIGGTVVTVRLGMK